MKTSVPDSLDLFTVSKREKGF